MDPKKYYRKTFRNRLTKIAQQHNTIWLDSKIQNTLKTELKRLIATHKKRSPINLLLYYPLPIEFDTRKILALLKKQKIQIFLPLMQGISFKVVKYRLPMQKGDFGIYESRNSSFKIFKLDYAVVPVIGIDQTFRRIGFGKGMYDRFFSTLKTQPKTIFICRALNLTQQTITQPYDLQANTFITPFALLKLKDIHHGNMGCNKFYSLRNHCRWQRLSSYPQAFAGKISSPN